MSRSRVAFALAAATLLASCGQHNTNRSARVPTSPAVWFDSVQPRAVDNATLANLARQAWQALHGSATSAPGPLSPRKRGDEGPTLLFLSLSNGTAPATVVLGAGKTTRAALASAVALAKRPTGPRYLELDVVTSVAPLRRNYRIVRGLDGVAGDRQSRRAILPGVFTLASGRERNTMRKHSPFRFRTASVFYDGKIAVPLFRGHPRRRPLTGARVLAAARAGGDYLVRMRHPNGRFIYDYDAGRDAADDDYNLVRHAGTVYAMLQLYRVSHDATLLAAAEAAIDYLLGFIKPYRAGTLVLRSGDHIKLGGVALAAVALTEHVRATGDKRHLKTAQGLCKYIAWSQGKHGRVAHKREFDSGEVDSFRSQYYPGEAMLALLRVHAIDGAPHWVDTAANLARYLITVRDSGKATADLTHDHWLLYALNELYRVRKQPMYLRHAARIVEAIVAAQNTGGKTVDHLGSYYDPPRSTPTATRSEGLLAAHALISEFGDEQLAGRIRRAVKRGVGFQLQTQITRERAMYLRDPRRSLGGFTRSLGRFDVRIDYVQHNISALILLYQLLSP